jgi:hypothetical protein
MIPFLFIRSDMKFKLRLVMDYKKNSKITHDEPSSNRLLKKECESFNQIRRKSPHAFHTFPSVSPGTYEGSNQY